MDTQKTSDKIGIFSFFAGAGFLDLGFETTAGFEVLFVNEFHKPFMEVYKESRKGLKIDEPIYGHSTDDIGVFLGGEKATMLNTNIQQAKNTHDLIGFIGGPPCPDFSVGGKNRGVEGENGRLSATYVQLIVQNQPDFFLFENVKGLYRTKKHRAFFDSVKQRLISNGYCLTEKLINAIEYGVPQDRDRIILIGFKNSTLKNLKIKEKDKSTLNSFDWNSKVLYNSEEIFSKNWPTQEQFVENGDRSIPTGVPIELTAQYWFDRNDVENHPNSKHYFSPRSGLARFLSVQEGDDLKKSFKRLHRWRYSPTAAYGNNEVHLHPYKARRISAAEALAIQSLPREFIIPEHISLTNMFKTIGNGVPYLAARGLAETLANFIEKAKLKTLKYAETIG